MKKKYAAVMAVLTMLLTMSGCFVGPSSNTPELPKLATEHSYVNYNNQSRAEMHIEEDTLYLTYEEEEYDGDPDYANHLFSVSQNGLRQMGGGLPFQFIKNGTDIYYIEFTDDTRYLKKMDTETDERVCVLEKVDAFLVYHDMIVASVKDQLLTVSETGECRCLSEGRFPFITANETAVFAVEENGTVWQFVPDTWESRKIGAVSYQDHPFSIAVSGHYLAARFLESKDVAVLDMDAGDCQTYHVPFQIEDMTAGRNDTVYFVGCENVDSTRLLYQMDPGSGQIKEMAELTGTVIELYIYDDEWIYVADHGYDWRFGVNEIERIATDGSKREPVYSTSLADYHVLQKQNRTKHANG